MASSIDLAESLLTLSQASKILPGRPHPSTLWRWYRHGVSGGIKLETFVVGGRRFTSREALQRFVDRATVNRDGIRPERAVGRRHQAAIAAAEAELTKAGI